MISVSAAYAAENAKNARTPQYRVRFANVSSPPEQNYVTHAITGDPSAHQLMQTPRGFAAQVVPEKGSSSTGPLTFVLEDDASQTVTGLVVTGIDGTTVHVDMGYDVLGLVDWVTDVYVGIVDTVRMTDDHTGYEITLAAVDTLTNKTVFQVSSTTVIVAINSSATSVYIKDGNDFLASGYISVDNEIIQYSGVVASGVQPSLYSWNKVRYANSVFIAVGQDTVNSRGVISRSTDGLRWYTGGTTPTSVTSLTDIVYSSSLGRWVATGVVGSGSSAVITSDDNGLTWTARVTPYTSYHAIEWSSSLSLFVIASHIGSDFASSADGITWTVRTGSSFGAYRISWVSWLTTPLFIGVSSIANRTASSPDGIVWTDHTPPGGSSPFWRGIADNGSVVVAVGITGVGSPVYITTTDGLSWTAQTPAGAEDAIDIVWDSSAGFVVIGHPNAGGGCETSPDGVAWTNRSVASTDTWTSLAVTPGHIFVAVNNARTDSQAAMYAPDASLAWGLYYSRLTGLTRGINSTTAAAHAVAAGVRELLYLSGHPMDILTGVLENTDKTGAGIAPTLISGARIAAIRTALGPTKQMVFWVDAADNLAAWLAREIYQPLGLYPVTTGGLYSIYQTVDTGSSPPPSTVDSVTDDVICIDENGKPILAFDTNFKNSVLNSVTVLYDWDPIAKVFNSTLTVPSVAYPNSAATTSQNTNGVYPITFSSKGLNSSLAGTVDMIIAVAATFLARHHNGMAALTARVFLRKNLLEGGDIVAVTSKFVPNPVTKTNGITAQPMEVASRSIVWADGHVDLNLLWPDWR